MLSLSMFNEYPVIGGALVGFLSDLPSFAWYGLYRRGAGLIRGRAGDLAVVGDGDADADAARTAALATPMPILVLTLIDPSLLVVTLVAKATLVVCHPNKYAIGW